MPVVKALKNFRGTEAEGMVLRGSEIDVDDERHKALAKNGLVTAPDTKKAPEPQNKMAPEPQNQAITSETIGNKSVTRVPLGDPDAAEKIVEAARPLSPPGGKTGQDRPRSSSDQAHRQPWRSSSKPEDEPAA